jgi:hypothetical protein
MHCLPMEAELVILEEPSLQCRQIYFHYYNSSSLWYNLLGPWRQNVSHATVNILKQTHLQYVIDAFSPWYNHGYIFF